MIPARLLAWTLALAGLSAAWRIEEDLDPGDDLSVAALAASALDAAGDAPRA